MMQNNPKDLLSKGDNASRRNQ